MRESCYKTTVDALKAASNAWIPVHRECATKFWWDQNMQELKQRAVDTHRLWVGSGKPRSGPVFLERNQAKYNYRFQIKKQKMTEFF